MAETIADLTKQFVVAREAKERLRTRQKEELAPLLQQEHELEVRLLQLMNEQGLNSAPNENGTPYRTLNNRYPVVDWESFFDFVKDNGLGHMIERRAAKASVEEYREAHGELPPGLSIKSEVRIRVRSK